MMDAQTVALIGYSMGGYGAINTVGACFDFSTPVLKTLGMTSQQVGVLLPLLNYCHAGRSEIEKRWPAMIAFAPGGGSFLYITSSQ